MTLEHALALFVIGLAIGYFIGMVINWIINQ